MGIREILMLQLYYEPKIKHPYHNYYFIYIYFQTDVYKCINLSILVPQHSKTCLDKSQLSYCMIITTPKIVYKLINETKM